jgi:DNA-binding MarR family transcriptional regulator
MHMHAPKATSLKSAAAPCYGASARRASRILTRIYDEAIAPSGLNLTQFSIAYQLSCHGAAAIGDLARWMDTDKTAMGRNLGPLEREGLVLISAGEDRRSRMVSLTSRGKRSYRQALPYWRKAQKQVEKLMGEQDAFSLRALLHQVSDRRAGRSSQAV